MSGLKGSFDCFVGIDGPEGGHFPSASQLAKKVGQLWPQKDLKSARPFVVCTGGEPLLQLDAQLIAALHDEGFKIAVETNGTIMPPPNIDWLCVSPKAGAELLLRSGQEIKLIFPQLGAEPEKYDQLDFQHFFLQPMDSPDRKVNVQRTLDYVLAHPQWRISLQLHKILGIK